MQYLLPAVINQASIAQPAPQTSRSDIVNLTSFRCRYTTVVRKDVAPTVRLICALISGSVLSLCSLRLARRHFLRPLGLKLPFPNLFTDLFCSLGEPWAQIPSHSIDTLPHCPGVLRVGITPDAAVRLLCLLLSNPKASDGAGCRFYWTYSTSKKL